MRHEELSRRISSISRASRTAAAAAAVLLIAACGSAAASGVTSVLFADARDGWAYGPGQARALAALVAV